MQKRLDDTESNEPKRLLLFFDEFKQIINKCKIQGSVLLPCLTTLFESNRYESQTKQSSINLEDCNISILACTTKATFESMWTPAFTDIGFNNRLFLVPGTGKRKFAIPKQIPDSDKKEINSSLNRLLALIGKSLQMEITDDANKFFESWYLGIEQSVHAKRIDTYALRLMPLLAINDGKTFIDIETTEKAIKLANWQLEVRRELDPIDADNEIAKMEIKIRKYLVDGSLKKRKLQQKTNANKKGLWCFESAIKNLIKSDEIEFDATTKCYRLKT